MKKLPVFFAVLFGILSCVSMDVSAQDAKKPKAAPKAKSKAKKAKKTVLLSAIEFVGGKKEILKEGEQIDLPAAAVGKDGAVYVAYLEWNGTSDSLRIARETDAGFKDAVTLVEDGILHMPALAADREGTLWCAWGETQEDETVDLFACSWSAKEGQGDIVTLSDSDAAEAFVDGGTDSEGRPWFAWQSMRAGEGNIYARWCDPATGEWSPELTVTDAVGGDWEPDLAFDKEGNAWVLYDSSRGNEFNLYLAKVSPEGEVKEYPIGHSERFEARGSLALDAEGTGFWIAAEQGKERWGLDARGHENNTGINALKKVLFGRFDLASAEFTETPMGPAGQAGSPVNVPAVGVGASGDPWVAYRYFQEKLWRIAVSSYRRDKGTWSVRQRVDGSSYGQDRTSYFLPASGGKGDIRFCWPSDGRTTKEHKTSGVFLASLASAAGLPDSRPPVHVDVPGEEVWPPSQETPERPAYDRHTWKVEGQEYGLFWGDLHRHTDVSNCRTGFDGCIMDHFRYAYDMAKLDFLGTTDHTDVGKFYHPYEWWHNQRVHDEVHSPGRFNSIYAYEREQRWPWGHRNVVFARRGGPVVYIKRNLYRSSPWQELYPIKAGLDEITPMELWDVLNAYDQPVALISHTGATRMGTDWSMYERFDYSDENLVEIFQGARVSYEGEGAPQPTAGLKPEEKYTVNGDNKATDVFLPPNTIDDFGTFKMGTYQTALELGKKLGVFASSDHISQHVSYGGVYCKEFTREGIIEGFDARRTIAATDKIYLDFTCNGKPLGSIFESDADAELWFRVDGTAPLKRITIVRNEEDWKTMEDLKGKTFETTLTDETMIPGENRYYVRVEQKDGNMAWSSPVWVTRKAVP